MQEYMEKHREYFSNVTLETYQAVRELLHSETQLKHIRAMDDGKESVNMCKALDDIYNDGLSEGIEEGMKTMILTCCELGLSKEEILEKIMKNSSITMDVAKELIEKHVR